MPGPEPVTEKYAKNAGWFQCVIPGRIRLSKSARISPSGSPSLGGAGGSRRSISPGATWASTGRSPTLRRNDATQSDASASASRSSSWVGPGPVAETLIAGSCQMRLIQDVSASYTVMNDRFSSMPDVHR